MAEAFAADALDCAFAADAISTGLRYDDFKNKAARGAIDAKAPSPGTPDTVVASLVSIPSELDISDGPTAITRPLPQRVHGTMRRSTKAFLIVALIHVIGMPIAGYLDISADRSVRVGNRDVEPPMGSKPRGSPRSMMVTLLPILSFTFEAVIMKPSATPAGLATWVWPAGVPHSLKARERPRRVANLSAWSRSVIVALSSPVRLNYSNAHPFRNTPHLAPGVDHVLMDMAFGGFPF